MRNATFYLHLLLDVLPGALGALALAGAVLAPAWLARHAPGLAAIGANPALCLLLCGAALLARRSRRRPLRRLLPLFGAATLLLSAGVLLRALLGDDLPAGPADVWFGPGAALDGARVLPYALFLLQAGAFLCAGLALLLSNRPRGRTLALTHGLGMLVAGMALAGFASTVFENILFYNRWSERIAQVAPLMLGLLAVGAGLYLAASGRYRYRSFCLREDRQIFASGIALFTLISLVAGLIGIGIVGRHTMRSFEQALWASYRANTELFQVSLESALARSAEIVRLSRLDELVGAGASDAQLQRELERIARLADFAELSSLQVTNARGETVARSGSPSFAGQFNVPLPVASRLHARLYWDAGWRLQVRVPLGGEFDGTAVALEVLVVRFERQFAQMERSGRTGETRVCALDGAAVRCFPTRLDPTPRSAVPAAAALLPMRRALRGEQGVGAMLDYRGHDVIAAYGKIDKFGLGVVQKIDADELYQPLRSQLWLALLGLALLIVAGAAALYWRTRPLVAGLVRARARLAAILNNVPAGVVTIDADGVIRSANRTAARLFGYENRQLSGQPGGQLSGQRFERILQAPGQSLSRPALGVQALRARRADGAQFEAEVVASDFRIGRDIKRIAIIQDVSERRRMECQLKLWGHVFEHASWGMLIGSPDGDTLELMNPAFAQMHGHTVRELTGRSIVEVFAPELRDGVAAHIAQAHSDGRHSFESRHVRKDGSSFPVWVDVAAVRDEQGVLLYRAVNVLDISARKRMEQDLRQSEQLLRNILDALPVGVWVVGADGATVMTNPMAARIWDGAPAGGEWGVGAALGGAGRFNDVTEVEQAGGARKTIRHSAVPLRHDGGAVLVGEDITEARGAEQALRASEAALAEAQRIAHIGSWQREIGSSRDYCGWSDETYRIFGLAPRSVEPAVRLVESMVHPDDLPRLERCRRDALAGRAPYDVTVRIVLPGGAQKVLHSLAQIEFDADGRALRMSGTVQDITEKVRAEQLLRKREEEFRALVENSPDLILRFDRALRFVYANPALAPVTGLGPEELLGKRFDETPILARIAAQWTNAIGTAFDFAATETFEFSFPARGTLRHYQVRLTPEFGPDGQAHTVLAVARDISVIKAGEAVLRESERRLRELSAHMESVREEERKKIAREVHDELGQALTVLRMDVSLLRLNFGGQSPQLMERIVSMKEVVDRTIHIVRHVTSALRPAALDLGLTAALEWLVEDVRRHADIDCTLRTNDDYEVVLDDGQATALFRIAQESLTNVLKHAGASAVEVALDVEDGQIRLEVFDNGAGFSPAAARRVGAFGLMGMRERALMLGGDVEVRSAPGEGTSVRVRLPITMKTCAPVALPG
jgi:PAS domain S-box-containing protein